MILRMDRKTEEGEEKMEERQISQAVIRRLPRYYRYLGELLENSVERISSNELSKRMNVTASQIRQDLNNFGGFGQQGYGYNVKYLYTEIGKILGLDVNHNMIILGACNLGQALANYAAFERSGFVFGIVSTAISILFSLIKSLNSSIIRISIPRIVTPSSLGFTIPKTKAIEVADMLVESGIKAIWNFAHTDLELPEDVIVENVHLSESLMRLSYNVNRYHVEHTTEE